MKFTKEQIEQMNQEIPAIAIAGEWGAGKSLFALMRPVTGKTAWFHTEPSGANYTTVVPNVERIEINNMDNLRQALSSIKDVDHIIVDTIAPIEEWLFDDVIHGIDLYGKPVKPSDASRYAKDSSAAWGETKKREIVLLQKFKDRAKVVTITSHMRAKYIGNRPSGAKEPRVKDVVYQFVSLFLGLERMNGQAAPAGEVLKSTLMDKKHFAEQGQLRPVLPPRLPQADWETIWRYIETPVDMAKLDPAEQSQAIDETQRLQLLSKLASDGDV